MKLGCTELFHDQYITQRCLLPCHEDTKNPLPYFFFLRRKRTEFAQDCGKASPQIQGCLNLPNNVALKTCEHMSCDNYFAAGVYFTSVFLYIFSHIVCISYRSIVTVTLYELGRKLPFRIVERTISRIALNIMAVYTVSAEICCYGYRVLCPAALPNESRILRICSIITFPRV